MTNTYLNGGDDTNKKREESQMEQEARKLFSDAKEMLVQLLKDKKYEDANLRALDPRKYAYDEQILGITNDPTMIDDFLK